MIYLTQKDSPHSLALQRFKEPLFHPVKWAVSLKLPLAKLQPLQSSSGYLEGRLGHRMTPDLLDSKCPCDGWSHSFLWSTLWMLLWEENAELVHMLHTFIAATQGTKWVASLEPRIPDYPVQYSFSHLLQMDYLYTFCLALSFFLPVALVTGGVVAMSCSRGRNQRQMWCKLQTYFVGALCCLRNPSSIFSLMEIFTMNVAGTF